MTITAPLKSTARRRPPAPTEAASTPDISRNDAHEPIQAPGAGFRVAEFFAGIGLMAEALESRGYEIAWANDIEKAKFDLYAANRPDEGATFELRDVRTVKGAGMPDDLDLATASFPCIDLSLAGKREGLGGSQSGMFWEFARVLDEMSDEKRPRIALLENVHGFATSHGGADLRKAVQEMNRLGYSCDVFAINARHFVPQSRPRMFVVGVRGELPRDSNTDAPPLSDIRPEWVRRIYAANADLRMHTRELASLPDGPDDLGAVVETMSNDDPRWWDTTRSDKFFGSLTPLHAARLAELKNAKTLSQRTAYRRTRNGSATWEIRPDGIAGCLRTTGGGSSKQALVVAGTGQARVRWMTPLEYARLMGVGSFKTNARTDNQALFGFGDAVVVDVIQWITDQYLTGVLTESRR
ncbi:DNA cytosine methyltransferase [Cryobacterium sp. HLT2-28]|uniref:DNA cytosine methyltransferase n=1 Tax=Cryobacterium sp. HLT2-28 TaxID=1259146 RepID=UPI00106A309E|nr:DNA (cytosine-5-)-methyltransferase [Cryobacterium sp. HLT2-28]TFB91460.1 DNA (cytosine-5-)-methyltransferase [Cryobacterium sp. HLT2-28]